MLVRWTCLFILCCAGVSQAGNPDTQPVSLPDQAAAAIANQSGDAFVRAVDQQLAVLCADLQRLDGPQVTSLVIYRTLVQFAGAVDKPTAAESARLQWLVRQPELVHALMLAIRPEDKPDDVLEVLDVLYEAHGDRLLEMPGMVAALCVVWDNPPPRRGTIPTPATSRQAIDVFDHFYAIRGRGQLDFQQLPRELLVYLAANAVTKNEMSWAYQRYVRHQAIGRTYFDLAYDTAAFMTGSSKRIANMDYTLQNLLQVGGVCVEQAHFSSSVSRSVGVPAVIVIGDPADHGVRHAWLGYLQPERNGVRWNFDTGRYAEMKYWAGYIHDPQTHQLISESELAVTSQLCMTAPADRDLSRALMILAAEMPANVAIPLLSRAVSLSPGDRTAWMQLAEHGARGELSPAQSNDIVAALQSASRAYPDFVFTVYSRLLEGVPLNERLIALDRIAAMFQERRDLVARTYILRGDWLSEESPARAVQSYAEVISSFGDSGPMVLHAINRAERLLRRTGQSNQLVQLYQTAWTKMAVPAPSAHSATTPYFMVGQRFAEVARQQGNGELASRIERRLALLVINGPQSTGGR